MLVFLPASACNQRIIPQRRTTCGRCEALHVIRYEKCAALIEKITQGGFTTIGGFSTIRPPWLPTQGAKRRTRVARRVKVRIRTKMRTEIDTSVSDIISAP